MLVQDLFTRLSYGELSSLAIGDSGSGDIAAGKEEQVLSAITLALSAIYTRFQHRVSFLVLEATAGVSSYVLDVAHCESDVSEQTAPRYIKDVTLMDAPFPDDLIRVLSVRRMDVADTTTLDEQLILPINGRRAPAEAVGAKMLAFNEFRLANAVAGELFEVEYQAKHRALSLGEDGNVTIQIMPALEEALQARTAAALFAGMTGDAHVARAGELLARYERLCEIAGLNDMAQESGSDEFDKLRDKGFN